MNSVVCQYTFEPGQTVAPLQLVLMSIAAPTGNITVHGNDNADPNVSDNSRGF